MPRGFLIARYFLHEQSLSSQDHAVLWTSYLLTVSRLRCDLSICYPPHRRFSHRLTFTMANHSMRLALSGGRETYTNDTVPQCNSKDDSRRRPQPPRLYAGRVRRHVPIPVRFSPHLNTAHLLISPASSPSQAHKQQTRLAAPAVTNQPTYPQARTHS